MCNQFNNEQKPQIIVFGYWLISHCNSPDEFTEMPSVFEFVDSGFTGSEITSHLKSLEKDGLVEFITGDEGIKYFKPSIELLSRIESYAESKIEAA